MDQSVVTYGFIPMGSHIGETGEVCNHFVTIPVIVMGRHKKKTTFYFCVHCASVGP